MAEALVSIILEQLASIMHQQIDAEVKLVVGVDHEVQKLSSNFLAIKAVIEDAESREVKEKNVRDWLDKLEDVTYDMDDVLDEWNTLVRKLQMGEVDVINASKPMRKVCCLIPCYCFGFRQVVLRHDVAVKIKELNRKLDVIAMERNMFNFSLTKGTSRELKTPVTTSFIDVSYVHGRDDDKDKLLKMLLSESSQEPAISIMSIVGMGGIGKTTLARLVFNHVTVNTHFDQKLWVCVSEPFDEIRIAKAILESLGGDTSHLVELQTVLQRISQYLERKKFLLVLDDVWTEDSKDWEQLKNCLKCASPGSRILATTCKTNVAKIIGTTNTNMILLGLLSEEESWSLFSQLAFFGRTTEEYKKLEDIGRRIIGKCKGMPLAIKTLGSLLHLKSGIKEWQSVLYSEIWELEEVERGIFPPLLLSYYDLPSMLRKYFVYCAIFPKDYEIKKDKLIKLWMAQSYVKDERIRDMESIGEEYFENLAMRSFFQDLERDKFDGSIISCKMHDIVHDFAQYLSKNECFSTVIDYFEESRVQFSWEKSRHLMVRHSFPMSIYKARNLRSLVVKGISVSEMTLSELFDNFVSLRALELNGSNKYYFVSIEEMPKQIKRLIHLRYLDLSESRRLQELPETLCELYNLQTLNLNNCRSLKRLPQDIGKLVNLRHLINNCTCYYSLSEMPKGVEGLTCPRTLHEFCAYRHRQGTKVSTLHYLRNLNNLQGSLDIMGLGNVGNVGDFHKANFMNKRNLLSLGLFFRGFDEVWENGNEIDEAFFEAQPPPNLETLKIFYYRGKTLSLNWMLSLTKLRFVTLFKCINWEEWDITKKGYGNEEITIMPSLNSLVIYECKKLRSLPDHILQSPTLKQLQIIGCPLLKERYNKETGQDWIKISHIPNIEIVNY